MSTKSASVRCDGALPLRNHADTVSQSAGVKFGLLPERQVDLLELARHTRAAGIADIDATFAEQFGTEARRA